MVDGLVVFVCGRDVCAVVGNLDHGLLRLDMPERGAALLGSIEISVDGRQKNKIFHVPILQGSRNVRRRETVTSIGRGSVRWRWCSNGRMVRSQGD